MEPVKDIIETIAALRAQRAPFALATVVRTVAATAAKAGAKAVILPDGTIRGGWIGGGCARAAVLKAAKDTLSDGKARLVSVQPEAELNQIAVLPGEERGGVRFAKNACPSQGTMDIFVEAVLPRPELVVWGSSPVALAVADLGSRLGFSVTACAPAADQDRFQTAERRVEGYALPPLEEGKRYIVVSTQGSGDEAALAAALESEAEYVAFVGSRRKAQVLSAKLAARGVPAERLTALKSPAGLDIGAITPEEIALSILAEIVAVQRAPQRTGSRHEG